MRLLDGIEKTGFALGVVDLKKMDSSRQIRQRRSRSKDSFERKMDNWIETGRQFVDGVSGSRPGRRRLIDSNRFTRPNFDNVSRWVEDKLDWILEDEDDWLDDNAQNNLPEKLVKGKKPLGAISRRVPRLISQQEMSDDIERDSKSNVWPDESSFRVERWKRVSNENNRNLPNSKVNTRDKSKPNNRPLPRSSRKLQS